MKVCEPMSLAKVVIIVFSAGITATISKAVAEPPVSAEAAAAHAAIEEYTGPAVCVACHPVQTENMFGSVHYQLTGPTPNVTSISGNAGKGELGFNTYCGTALSSPRATCASCHVGNGKTPSANITTSQLHNIDCLMCHQEKYKRKAIASLRIGDIGTDGLVNFADFSRFASQWREVDCRAKDNCGGADLNDSNDVDGTDLSLLAGNWLESGGFRYLTFTDYLGVEHSWQMPIEDASGNFQYGPDEENMTITILEAARTVHLPTRASCLRCHAYSGGSDGGKRGDISSVTVDPPLASDIHMSPQGENMVCRNCHLFENHKVLGRGLDLRPNDLPQRLMCTSGECHPSRPHPVDSENNDHTARVACQSCHIPKYAKDISTEVSRDWNSPNWSADVLGGQSGYKPGEVRDSQITPTYAWFDGTSRVYALGQMAAQNSAGEYEMAAPNGAVNSDDAKIYPMKEHRSNLALHDSSGQLIPHSTFKYFVTGDFARAVEDGMDYAGLAGSWTMVDAHNYQTINHGVAPKSNALDCGQCHQEYSSGGSVRMDLQGQLGYEQKGSHSQVCGQCHTARMSEGFEELHDDHVTKRDYDCAWCHNFTRPERGLYGP